jgi:hypothetical protein
MDFRHLATDQEFIKADVRDTGAVARAMEGVDAGGARGRAPRHPP